MSKTFLAFLVLVVSESLALRGQDRPIPHDVHVPCPLPTAAANDVRAVAVTPAGQVWAATADGLWFRASFAEPWQPVAGPDQPAAAFAVCAARDGSVWAGTWKGLVHGDDKGVRPVADVDTPVSAIGIAADGRVLVAGPRGFYLVRDGQVTRGELAANRHVTRIVAGPDARWWLATGMGVFLWSDANPEPDRGQYRRGLWNRDSFAVRGVAFDGEGRTWLATLGGLQVLRESRWERTWDSAHGLPSSDVRCVVRSPDGRIWAGTAVGLARRNGEGWSVRQGRRWLLHDDVRDLAFDAAGTAWVATAGGVSALRSEPVSLAEKARRFHAILEERHVRPPGIVEKCQLRTVGDLTTWAPMDDDNDGGYTALALAMESYRYAVTRDPAALAAARRAFAACEFLQRVTGTPGFLARTVVPTNWTEMHDPNTVLTPAAQAEELIRDPRDKYVPVRWRPSADGRWLWKGDTSSDEVTAHFFGYFAFHELAATGDDRRRVRDQICRVVDHLIEHGFVLRDLDGRPTRWGIWAPERLNDDPDWEMERGINSVEILSYLALAFHVSGDAKYAEASRRLIREHHYDRNVLAAPNLNPAWRTYIDLELLAFAYPALVSLETDPLLRRTYQRSFERWHETIRSDGNPFFEAIYAAYGSLRRANLSGARAFLADTPLDLIRWDVDLARREDVRLRRHPEAERWQTDRLLPASEIGYSRTDQNPWSRDHGEGGRSESDGVFWLLPYWMARHQGWIEATLDGPSAGDARSPGTASPGPRRARP